MRKRSTITAAPPLPMLMGTVIHTHPLRKRRTGKKHQPLRMTTAITRTPNLPRGHQVLLRLRMITPAIRMRLHPLRLRVCPLPQIPTHRMITVPTITVLRRVIRLWMSTVKGFRFLLPIRCPHLLPIRQPTPAALRAQPHPLPLQLPLKMYLRPPVLHLLKPLLWQRHLAKAKQIAAKRRISPTPKIHPKRGAVNPQPILGVEAFMPTVTIKTNGSVVSLLRPISALPRFWPT